MPNHRAWSIPGFAGALLLLAATAGGRGTLSSPQLMAAESLAGPVSAEVARVIDGDTLEVRAAIWLGQTLIVRVRIEGIDAPEIEGRCAEEKKRAIAARDYLTRRLQGAAVKLTRVVYDKYGGRVRADVSDANGDIGRALLQEGLVRAYHGERREPWCAAG